MLEFGVIVVYRVKRFVRVHIVIVGVDDTERDIGAMVTNSFKVCEKIGPDKSCLDSTFTALKTDNVAVTECSLEDVDDFFDGLYIVRHCKVVVDECAPITKLIGKFKDDMEG